MLERIVQENDPAPHIKFKDQVDAVSLVLTDAAGNYNFRNQFTNAFRRRRFFSKFDWD